MPALIYFTRELPGLSEELTDCGFQVYEALAISEVLYLCEQHPDLCVVIDASVEAPAAQEVASRKITLQLKAHAKAQDIIWELNQIGPQIQ